MRQLHAFSLGLLVEDLRLGLFDLQFGIMVKLLDHISIHLDVVPLGFDLGRLLLVELEVALELGSDHLHEFVVRLLFFLGFLGAHLRSCFKLYFKMMTRMTGENDSKKRNGKYFWEEGRKMESRVGFFC